MNECIHINMSIIGHLEERIKRAYEIIGRETPLKADCGQLCGAVCCKDTIINENKTPSAPSASIVYGASRVFGEYPNIANYIPGHPESTGMILFPGEVNLLANEPGFRLYRIMSMGVPAWFLVCEGKCDRRKRPLACRIYPLAPHISESGSITAKPDPRAAYLCPLASGENLAPSFRRAVTKAFRHLAGEPEIMEYMRQLSSDLEDMRRFTNKKKTRL